MNVADVITPHDASPETAIGAIRNHVGPVLLDLDETLYLRNSTEDFIDSARPPLAALLLMRMLDVIKPWRWTGGEATRDVWRVRLISACFPWTGNRWKNRVAGLAKNFANQRLMAALATPGTTPIITTVGFQPIVAPLVAALGLPQARIVAARLTTFADRRDGKLHLAVGALGDDTVRRALVLTDSAQDLTLLNACARIIFPEHRGQGVGTAAQGMLVEYLFDTTTAHRLWAGTESDNIAEQKALLKCGFVQEGVQGEAVFRAGEWHDSFIYGLLRNER